jgi:formylmethanofuran dehydrogenase subunit E
MERNGAATLERPAPGHKELTLVPAADYKRCSKCGEKKAVTEFHRRSASPDGRQPYCRACNLRERHDWEQANSTRYAATSKRWAKKNRERFVELHQENRRRHPEKYQARSALTSALRSGKITKPDLCENCGERTESPQLHGHHVDYSKPLDVEWLCEPCHLAAHGKKKRL